MFRKMSALVGALSIALGVSTLGPVESGVAANSTTPVQAKTSNHLAQGKACLAKGQYGQAVQLLECAVKQQPASCEGHLLLGQAYCKVKNYLKARDHLRAAIRIGKGSPNAQKANMALMTLPKNLLKPRTGSETRMIASMLGLSRDRGEGGSTKPMVIDFYASWCAPCKQLTPIMEKAKAQYGDKVSFMHVDVDDPNNERLVDQYEVSPIPTLIFLNPEGEVVNYSIGFSGDTTIDESIKKILASAG